MISWGGACQNLLLLLPIGQIPSLLMFEGNEHAATVHSQCLVGAGAVLVLEEGWGVLLDLTSSGHSVSWFAEVPGSEGFDGP
jgi:hypothetical protein